MNLDDTKLWWILNGCLSVKDDINYNCLCCEEIWDKELCEELK